MSPEFDYDIIIVGAGPAGLSAGYHAAATAAGAKVLIVDKKRELGKPVRCGEAVIDKVFSDSGISPSKKFISNKPTIMKCVSSKGKELIVNLVLDGYILDRVKFEQHLGARAESKGVKIKLKTTVVGLEKNKIIVSPNKSKSKETITGKIIIGADGVESRVGRWAGIETAIKPRDIAVCYQYLLDDIAQDIDKNVIEFYWGSKYSPHGYIWVFPKSRDSANVGIFSPGSYNKSIISLLARFISSRFKNPNKLRGVAGCVPQAVPSKQFVKNNVIVIGDAARVAIPVTGGGIGHAMTTGKLAGEISGEVIFNNLEISELAKFDREMKIFRKKIKRAHMLKEKILNDDDIFELLFGLFLPLQYIYKISPNLIEKYLLKSLRY